MKGITHFVSGVAIASCFPVAVDSIYQSKGLLLPLGGLFAILPDTLDFRFTRYLWKSDKVVALTRTIWMPDTLPRLWPLLLTRPLRQAKW